MGFFFKTGGAGGGGSSTFIGLTDVPASFTGYALKGVRVNAGETALEFANSADMGIVQAVKAGFAYTSITALS